MIKGLNFYLESQKIGVVIIIFAVLLALSLYYFTSEIQKLNAFLHRECPLPPEICPYSTAIPPYSVIAFTFVGGLALFGGILILSTKQIEKIETKRKRRVKRTISSLKDEEKQLYRIIADADGVIFQSELVSKSGLSKVKVSRTLDALESKNLVERRRRGMANVVVLK